MSRARLGQSFLGLIWSTFITAPVAGVAPQHIHLVPYFLRACILTLRHSNVRRKPSLATLGNGLDFLTLAGRLDVFFLVATGCPTTGGVQPQDKAVMYWFCIFFNFFLVLIGKGFLATPHRHHRGWRGLHNAWASSCSMGKESRSGQPQPCLKR